MAPHAGLLSLLLVAFRGPRGCGTGLGLFAAGLVCEAAGARAAVFSLWGRLQGCWAAYERVFERSGPLRDAF